MKSKVTAEIKLDSDELFRISLALRDKLAKHADHADKFDDKHKVFKMNAERDLRLFLRIAPLVEDYQELQAILDEFPLNKFDRIR